MPDEVITATPASVPDTTDTPAPVTEGATPVAATPATPQASAIEAGREGWVPSYRLRETREAAIREAQTAFAEREAAIRREADQYRTQLHALVGVQQPQNPEIEAVRQQFRQLFPKLAQLEERGEDVMSILERAGDMESQNSHYWQSYGRQTMDRLFEHATTSLGSPLTEEGKRALHSSFVGFVQSSPELTERYANDPTIVDEFWKMFTSTFVDPVRRNAAATVSGRAAATATLPQDTPGGAPRVSPGPKPANLDERAAQAWAQYQTLNSKT